MVNLKPKDGALVGSHTPQSVSEGTSYSRRTMQGTLSSHTLRQISKHAKDLVIYCTVGFPPTVFKVRMTTSFLLHIIADELKTR